MANKSKLKFSIFEFEVGETVFDDLTLSLAEVIGRTYDEGTRYGENRSSAGCVGYWLNNAWLGGDRHPWEISKVPIRGKK